MTEGKLKQCKICNLFGYISWIGSKCKHKFLPDIVLNIETNIKKTMNGGLWRCSVRCILLVNNVIATLYIG